MTPTEARALADTLARGWPTKGVPADIWQPALEPLDYDAALEAIMQLIDTRDTPPSILSFRAAYNAARAPKIARLREPCDICGGSGWEQIAVHRDGYPHPTSGVVPCRCSNGRIVDAAHRRALEHNADELRRTRPLNATEEHAA